MTKLENDFIEFCESLGIRFVDVKKEINKETGEEFKGGVEKD